MRIKSPYLRALPLTLVAVGASVLLASVYLPGGSADAGDTNSLQRCRERSRSATVELRRVERELATYKAAYEELVARNGGRPQLEPRGRDRRQRSRPHHDRHQRGPRAMSRDAFARLHRQFKDATFKSAQLRTLRRALRYGYLTANQLVRLLRLVQFDSGRIEMAAAAYPYIVDPQNFIEVYGVFTFDSSKRKLEAQIDGQSAGQSAGRRRSWR